MSCEECKEKKHSADPVPYIVHESDMVRNERNIKRIVIAMIIQACLIAILIGICYKINRDSMDKIEAINKYWIDYISQYDFDDFTVDLSTDGGGNANYIGANGDIYNGTSNSKETNAETEGRQSERQSDAP